MQGLMMNVPLLITDIMRHAERCHGDTEVVSFTVDDPRHRTTLREVFRRSRKLANALARAGVGIGDRIGTLAWNDYRHLELYYGVSCMGAVLHTVNPRLFPEQVAYIVNHAEDRLLFVDPLILPLIEKLRPALKSVEQVVVLTDDAQLPKSALEGLVSYEAFIGEEPDTFDWPDLDENTASSLCYTSGTTGNPKGVLFSHRSTVLHNYAALLGDALGCTRRDTMLVVVPMFHANAWGEPYAAPSVGTKMVLPGPKMGDGATLAALIKEEAITLAAGVPTVWQLLLNHARESNIKLDPLRRVSVGGSACPLAIMEEFRERHGAEDEAERAEQHAGEQPHAARDRVPTTHQVGRGDAATHGHGRGEHQRGSAERSQDEQDGQCEDYPEGQGPHASHGFPFRWVGLPVWLVSAT